jgi:hypothetical protein
MILIIAIVAAVVLIIGLILTLAIRSARKRKEAVAAFASELGFEAVTEADLAKRDGLATLPLFAKKGLCATNIIQGRVSGMKTALFDYVRVDGEGDIMVREEHTVVAFEGPRVGLPVFRIQRKKPRSFSLGREIETNPEFGRAFRLTGKNEADIRKTFSAELAQFLMSENVFQHWQIEGGGSWLVFWTDPMQPRYWGEFMDKTRVADGFFRHCGSAAQSVCTVGGQ